MSEYYFLSGSMGRELKILMERGVNKEDAIAYLYKHYSVQYKIKKVYLEIFQGSNKLFSSFYDKSLENQNPGSAAGNRTVTLKRLNHQEFIVINGEFPNAGQEYKIQYIYDITDMMVKRTKMYYHLLLIGVCVSIIIAFALMLILNIIFKPLSQIVAVSKEIDNDAKQKQQFVDNFSHEIRAPLTSVYGFAEYMQKTVLTEEERITITGYIMEDSKHILNIADKLLDLATLRNRNLIKKNCSVKVLFDSVLKVLQGRIHEKHIHLVREKNIDFIFADEDLLQSLLINLTNNAIDACENNGTIKWQAYSKDGYIILSICDNGKGIDSVDLEKINEPFYRVDKSRSRANGNAGLGLAICRQIVECHNADIIFESKLKLGTTVQIIFTTS